MATIASLNVSIGASIAELQKGLKSAERELRASGARLSKVGAEISTGLSIPLALAGVGAIKAAGDMESLTLALQSQLGSVEAAKKEFDLLNQAAKNPGLGVEQAVLGSIRLQGVKFSADEARKVLIEMGNAIARTGGTAENLDSVTKQFAQMSSKGRVLQSDISVIAESMPALSGLMQAAFGTTNVEAIRDMGVSGKEFVLQITKAAEALPRVEGGIKNSIGNAMDSLKQSAAKVGLAINQAFNITGALETFAGFLQGIAEGFTSLNPVVQKIIIAFAGIVVVIGPIFKVIGAVQLLRAQAISAFDGIISGAKSLAGGILVAVRAFQALSVAQKATVIGLAITAVTALYFAYKDYAGSLTDAQVAQKSLNDVQLRAADSIAGQKSQVDGLVRAYSTEGATLTQKRNILNELKKISPEYFGTLKVGKGDVEALTTATKLYGEELLRVAKITAAKERLVEIEKSLLGLSKAAEPSALQTFGNLVLSGGNSLIFASEQAKSYSNNINEQRKTLEAESAALVGLVTQQTLADAATGKLSERTKDLSSSVGDVTPKAKVLAEVLADIAAESDRQKLLGLDELEPKLRVAESGLKKLLDAGWKPNTVEVMKLAEETRALQAEWNALKDLKKVYLEVDIIRKDNGEKTPDIASAKGFGDTSGNVKSRGAEQQIKQEQDWADAKTSIAFAAEQAAFDIFSNFADQKTEKQLAALEAEGKQRLANAKGNAALEAAIQADLDRKRAAIEKKASLRKKIAALGEAAINIAVGITKAIASAPPPLNVPAIVAAAAQGAIQLGVIASQKFAAGTRDAPGGIALVGERGPEFVNLPKHSQVFSAGQTATALRGAGQNVTLSGEFRIKGTDLVLVYDREKVKSERFK